MRGLSPSRDRLRESGIDILGKVPWGTHFCQFYATKRDLVETLVPYFKEGLLAGEFCMWITSAPLEVEEARIALEASLPDLDSYLESGQMEILDYREWYTKSGSFDSDEVLSGWAEKLEAALSVGYEGLRLSGNTHWLEEADWDSFEQYEAAINGIIGSRRMIALCSYSLEKCGASEIIDVIANHEFALIKRRGDWEVIESLGHRNMEMALRESEERLRVIVENMPVGVIMIDNKGRTLMTNEALRRIWGGDNPLPEGFDEYWQIQAWWADSGKRVGEEDWPVHRAIRRKEIIPFQMIEIARPDGSIGTLVINASPLFDAMGEAVAGMAFTQDITTLVRRERDLEEVMDRLKSLIDQMPVGVAIAEAPSGNIFMTNSAFNQILHTSSDDIMSIDDYGKWNTVYLDGTPMRGEEHPMARAITKGEVIEGEEILTRLEDGHHTLLVSAGPLRDGRGSIIGAVSVIRDVTKLVSAESELLRKTKELERSNADLQRFAYIASHDLQEPLRMISGYLELLSNDYYQRLLDETADAYIRSTVEAAGRMRDLIDDILAYSRVSQKPKALSRVQMGVVLDTVLDNLKASISESEAIITYDMLPTIIADSNQILQVLQNLIGNAIKFRGREPPRVQVSAIRLADAWVFSVKDNGIGIAPEHHGKVFDMFRRLHRSDEYPGTGMGLAICRKIIEGHGGSMWLESREGEGATFLFSLPSNGVAQCER